MAPGSISPTTVSAASVGHANASAPANATQAANQALPSQLARPIFTLAGAGRGEHVMTVHVTPDILGPVTVRAHVGADGVRVELFAPTDTGRDALRAILPDLRRDLGAAGLSGSLDLSSQNQPTAQDSPTRGWTTPDQGADRRPALAHQRERDTTEPRPDGTAHTIDVMV